MKLLICTQVVDRDDAMLGFFHAWIEALAPRFESIEVICLKEGRHELPHHVTIHSLGKERRREHGTSLYRSTVVRTAYALRFLSLAWRLRNRYDAAFVHMNQEYVLLAGIPWRLVGKRVYMWRNHYRGSWITDIAAVLSTATFCTSKHSYIAKRAKNRLMPVGIDTSLFSPEGPEPRAERSAVLFGRIDPSKRLEVFVEALGMLHARGVRFSAAIQGPSVPSYLAELQRRAREHSLEDVLAFLPPVTHQKVPSIFRSYEIAVNCSPSGMYDKTLFESVACGCLPLASSRDFAELAGERYSFGQDDAQELARRLEALLDAPDKQVLGRELRAPVVNTHSLAALVDELAVAIY